MRIGYGRVSTRDQNPNAQHDALTAASCDEIFVDKKSGKLASRPELDKALLMVRRGDALVITRLNRLGNSLRNLLDPTAQLDERGVDLVVLEQGIDTTTPAGRLSFHVLAAVAQFQRELIVENILDGLAGARARAVPAGRSRSSARSRSSSLRRCTTNWARTGNAGTPCRRSPPSCGSADPRSTATSTARRTAPHRRCRDRPGVDRTVRVRGGARRGPAHPRAIR